MLYKTSRGRGTGNKNNYTNVSLRLCINIHQYLDTQSHLLHTLSPTPTPIRKLPSKNCIFHFEYKPKVLLKVLTSLEISLPPKKKEKKKVQVKKGSLQMIYFIHPFRITFHCLNLGQNERKILAATSCKRIVIKSCITYRTASKLAFQELSFMHTLLHLAYTWLWKDK